LGLRLSEIRSDKIDEEFRKEQQLLIEAKNDVNKINLNEELYSNLFTAKPDQ